MKALFVADIHIKLKKHKEWERSRFLALFTAINAQPVGMVIIGGDTFDTSNPSVEEIGLFYEGISLLKDKTVYVIDGNHEAFSKGKGIFHYLPQIGFTYIENSVINYKDYYLYLISYTSLDKINKTEVYTDATNILFSHFRSNYGAFVKQEISTTSISKKFDYIFVGDIHHKYEPHQNMFYPSAPYGINFEPYRDYGFYILNLDKKFSFKWVSSDLPSKVLLTYKAETLDNEVEQIVEELISSGSVFKILIQGIPQSSTLRVLKECVVVDSFVVKDLTVPEDEELNESVVDLKNNNYGTVDTLLRLLGDKWKKEQLEYIRKVLLNVDY